MSVTGSAARRRCQSWIVALASSVLASSGCADTAELRVSIDVDDALLPRERVLEVLAFDEMGEEIYRSEQLVGGASGVQLPAGVRVWRRSEVDGVALRVVLRAGPGDVRVSRDVWLGFPSSGLRALDLHLDAACEGVECDEGSSCACRTPGCAVPACVAVGPCVEEVACEGGGRQRCEHGGLAATCMTEGE